ncbi:cyclic GMP-AMP synthase-like isoform X2 [Leptopilina heterotoma]|uniref:cyclic GMP-AMP synthase-like isoform X2 n=1 Tax=Leptopilina heterotoma TaxID=63436 RepID=UPI001CAA128D|nr:cyclic GMP-AMP synthase-like isoform X2 [Leptopilina heterotoma]
MASALNKTGYQYKEDGKFSNDEILNAINNFVTLRKNDTILSNAHLDTVIKDGIIPLMKQCDPLFAKLYNSIMYGGSYYKGTKVEKPDEYDLNMIMLLPWVESTLKFETPEKMPGFIKIQFTKDSKLQTWDTFQKRLDTLISPNNYLDQNKFRELIESILSKSLQTLPDDPSFRKNGKILTVNNKRYSISVTKSGPAFTFAIKDPAQKEIDVDLVPSVEFSTPPPKRYKGFKNQCKWSIIPKPLNEENGNLMWRVSFYREEKEILKGPMKTVIRLLKKLRNTQNMKNFSSYFIETIGLNEIRAKENDPNFMKLPITCIFMHMLEKLCEAAKNHKIPFYYNKDFNLLYKISPIEMKNHADRFAQIISKINQNISTDPFIIAKYILTTVELNDLKSVYLKSNANSRDLKEITEKLEASHCILS